MIDLEVISSTIGIPLWLIALYILWEIFWKGMAMWKAAERKSPIWFAILLIANTAGILSILYIYLFSEIKLDNKKETKINLSRKKSRRRKSPTS